MKALLEQADFEVSKCNMDLDTAGGEELIKKLKPLRYSELRKVDVPEQLRVDIHFAVRDLQTAVGVNDDGKIGPITIAALQKALDAGGQSAVEATMALKGLMNVLDEWSGAETIEGAAAEIETPEAEEFVAQPAQAEPVEETKIAEPSETGGVTVTEVYTLHRDGNGSVKVAFNDHQEVVSEVEYDRYGNILCEKDLGNGREVRYEYHTDASGEPIDQKKTRTVIQNGQVIDRKVYEKRFDIHVFADNMKYHAGVFAGKYPAVSGAAKKILLGAGILFIFTALFRLTKPVIRSFFSPPFPRDPIRAARILSEKYHLQLKTVRQAFITGEENAGEAKVEFMGDMWDDNVLEGAREKILFISGGDEQRAKEFMYGLVNELYLRGYREMTEAVLSSSPEVIFLAQVYGKEVNETEKALNAGEEGTREKKRRLKEKIWTSPAFFWERGRLTGLLKEMGHVEGEELDNAAKEILYKHILKHESEKVREQEGSAEAEGEEILELDDSCIITMDADEVRNICANLETVFEGRFIALRKAAHEGSPEVAGMRQQLVEDIWQNEILDPVRDSVPLTPEGLYERISEISLAVVKEKAHDVLEGRLIYYLADMFGEKIAGAATEDEENEFIEEMWRNVPANGHDNGKTDGAGLQNIILCAYDFDVSAAKDSVYESVRQLSEKRELEEREQKPALERKEETIFARGFLLGLVLGKLSLLRQRITGLRISASDAGDGDDNGVSKDNAAETEIPELLPLSEPDERPAMKLIKSGEKQPWIEAPALGEEPTALGLFPEWVEAARLVYKEDFDDERVKRTDRLITDILDGLGREYFPNLEKQGKSVNVSTVRKNSRLLNILLGGRIRERTSDKKILNKDRARAEHLLRKAKRTDNVPKSLEAALVFMNIHERHDTYLEQRQGAGRGLFKIDEREFHVITSVVALAYIIEESVRPLVNHMFFSDDQKDALIEKVDREIWGDFDISNLSGLMSYLRRHAALIIKEKVKEKFGAKIRDISGTHLESGILTSILAAGMAYAAGSENVLIRDLPNTMPALLSVLFLYLAYKAGKYLALKIWAPEKRRARRMAKIADMLARSTGLPREVSARKIAYLCGLYGPRSEGDMLVAPRIREDIGSMLKCEGYDKELPERSSSDLASIIAAARILESETRHVNYFFLKSSLGSKKPEEVEHIIRTGSGRTIPYDHRDIIAEAFAAEHSEGFITDYFDRVERIAVMIAGHINIPKGLKRQITQQLLAEDTLRDYIPESDVTVIEDSEEHHNQVIDGAVRNYIISRIKADDCLCERGSAYMSLNVDEARAAKKSLEEKGIIFFEDSLDNRYKYRKFIKYKVRGKIKELRKIGVELSSEEVEYITNFFQDPDEESPSARKRGVVRTQKTALLVAHHIGCLDKWLARRGWRAASSNDKLFIATIIVAADMLEVGGSRYNPESIGDFVQLIYGGMSRGGISSDASVSSNITDRVVRAINEIKEKDLPELNKILKKKKNILPRFIKIGGFLGLAFLTAAGILFAVKWIFGLDISEAVRGLFVNGSVLLPVFGSTQIRGKREVVKDGNKPLVAVCIPDKIYKNIQGLDKIGKNLPDVRIKVVGDKKDDVSPETLEKARKEAGAAASVLIDADVNADMLSDFIHELKARLLSSDPEKFYKIINEGFIGDICRRFSPLKPFIGESSICELRVRASYEAFAGMPVERKIETDKERFVIHYVDGDVFLDKNRRHAIVPLGLEIERRRKEMSVRGRSGDRVRDKIFVFAPEGYTTKERKEEFKKMLMKLWLLDGVLDAGDIAVVNRPEEGFASTTVLNYARGNHLIGSKAAEEDIAINCIAGNPVYNYVNILQMQLSKGSENNADQYRALVDLLLTEKEDRNDRATMLGMESTKTGMNYIYVPPAETVNLKRLMEEARAYEKYVLKSM